LRTISWSKFQIYDVEDSDLDDVQARPRSLPSRLPCIAMRSA